MIKKAKEFLGVTASVVVAIAAIIIPLAITFRLISWYDTHFDIIYPWLVKIGAASSWIVLISVLIALFPMARKIAGPTIIFCSWVLGASLWLFNLFVSLNTVGYFWTVFGVLWFGVGVFATAGIGLLLKGEFSSLLQMLASLAIIFGLRFLGVFILLKHPDNSDEIQ